MIKETCDVLILSASYGGGHNQVAKALTQAMQMQTPGIKITTVDYCDLLAPFFNRLTQFGYSQSIRHFPVGYAFYYQAMGKMSPDSFWQKRLNRMGYSELIMLVNRLQPRVIVSIFPLPAGVLSQMKETGDLKIPVVTVITDICVHNQWIHPHTDLYLVGSTEVANGLVNRGIPKERIAVTGIPILPDFSRNFSKSEVKREFDCEEDDKIVLFMGGNEGVFGSTKFHHILSDLPAKTKLLLITGNNQDLYDKLHPLVARFPNFRLIQYHQNMASLMEAAHVLVTKAGGVTISEAMVKGLPMIIYKPIPGHEEANANYLWRHRAAIIAKGEHRLKTALQRMVIDEKFREHFRRNCLKISYPGSAEAGARLILNMLIPATREVSYYSVKLRREVSCQTN